MQVMKLVVINLKYLQGRKWEGEKRGNGEGTAIEIPECCH